MNPAARSTELKATIRLQFHKGFTLRDAVPLVSYFKRLGISHVYASPLLKARSGSMHGYDVVDPTRINPELGGEEALQQLVEELHNHDMSLIVDIVSNHMAVGGDANPWWLDVMEWGPMSPYADFFDIEWQSQDPLMQGQLLVPFLRTDYAEVLSSGEIKLHFDASAGSFYASHYEHHFPISPPCYAALLRVAENSELSELARSFEALNDSADPWHAAQSLRHLLAEQAQRPEFREAIEHALNEFTPGSDSGRENLHQLLESQHYRLASWRTAADDINWRRFFDINELGGLRVEIPRVFEAAHAKIFELIARGWIDGLRIDHIDGLADPRAYCRKLRRRINSLLQRPLHMSDKRFPIFVEKILAADEQLAEDWGINGTTGYEFMNQVSLLQHDSQGQQVLTRLWSELSGRPTDFMDEVYEARRLVLAGSLAADLETVAAGALQLARENLETRDLTLGSIRRAVTELIAHFPVYRTYAGACGRSATDQIFFAQAMYGARQALSEADWPILEQLDCWLGGEALKDLPRGQERDLHRKVLIRFQQLTSPAAAKAVEDTAFYRSAVLLSRYDVGFDPQHFSAPTQAFHQHCLQRLQRYPENLLTTATHDNKRGEDVRARLAVISERADWYADQLRHWLSLAAPLRQLLDDELAPAPADEIILYQTLLGSWPLDLTCQDSSTQHLHKPSTEKTEAMHDFLQRLTLWQEKSLREAKLKSSWSAPNIPYEAACREFLSALLTSKKAAELRDSLAAAAASIACAGALNSLSQCLLRMTVPGVPDLYQSNEFWDFNLVDPDNRRAVDFDLRVSTLSALSERQELLADWRDGRIKQALIERVLGLRRAQPQLFKQGDYLPLQIEGKHADRLIAFARCYQNEYILVVATLHCVPLLGDQQIPHIPPQHWADTRVLLPPDSGQHRPLKSLFTSGSIRPFEGGVFISELLADFPVNLLCSNPYLSGEFAMSADEERIREFAHQIWESEGRPEGQEARHWQMASRLAVASIEKLSRPIIGNHSRRRVTKPREAPLMQANNSQPEATEILKH